jgi:hypothetical protein
MYVAVAKVAKQSFVPVKVGFLQVCMYLGTLLKGYLHKATDYSVASDIAPN